MEKSDVVADDLHCAKEKDIITAFEAGGDFYY